MKPYATDQSVAYSELLVLGCWGGVSDSRKSAAGHLERTAAVFLAGGPLRPLRDSVGHIFPLMRQGAYPRPVPAKGCRKRQFFVPGVKPSRAGLHGLPRGSLALHPSINSSVLSQASHRIPTMGEGGRGRRGVGPANAPTFVSVVRR